MPTRDDAGGLVAAVGRPLTSDERAALRESLAQELPQLRGLLDAAVHAAAGPDPEAALVLLGMLTTRSSAIVFPL